MKYVLPLFVLAIVFAACNNNPKAGQDATAVTPAEFIEKAPDLVDQLVSMEGTVVHVCKHGGKRLFLGEERIKVLASNKVSVFDVALEGSDVVIDGFLREERIDEAYLAEWERELNESEVVEEKEVAHKGEPGHDHAEESEDHDARMANLQKIQEYREQIAASDKGYLSFYSVEASKLKEKK